MKPTYFTSPPVKSLMEAFKVSKEQATLARALIKGEVRITDNPQFPKTNTWLGQCYNKPRRIDLILSALNETLECHGVECLWGRDSSWPVAEYLNTGDTYSATLLFNHGSQTFRLTTWGDFYERNEKRLGLK